MRSNKLHHPDNFRFADAVDDATMHIGRQRVRTRVRDHGDGVFELTMRSRRWSPPSTLEKLNPPAGGAKGYSLGWDSQATLTLRGARRTLLEARFGVCGKAWMLRLQPEARDRFYGMGEKWGSLEKSQQHVRFYNTDVWTEFHAAQILEARIDPTYASIPYLVLKRRGVYVGILIHTSFPAFMATNPPLVKRYGTDPRASETSACFVGADDGSPSLWVLVGPDLGSLTRKLQKLCGTTPRPPLWALGHQQCRWGYRSEADLSSLEKQFRSHRIPNDGLWLDIDYMDGFRVFTVRKKHFRNVEKTLQRLRAAGQRVVPILDPGVKKEPGFRIYDEGRRGKHFCLTEEGSEFTGIVWPGETVFPDFATQRTRRWWAACVERFARLGFSGFWLDMNDPSTGQVEPSPMRFDQGRLPHQAFRNEYALGMAIASHQGLSKAAPSMRPFLVTRSASTSISRYAAVWTGDNYSNETHLKASIPTSLNLALSGVPFNAPDVPGFGGDADDDLMVRWYKTAFLFPFLRNHSCTGTRSQEPWAFTAHTTRRVRDCIRSRYKLLPYLYQLFVAQERDGEALLRPLFYDFASTPKLPLDHVDDQFMVGPALMQAPLLERAKKARSVVLPKGHWYALHTGHWLNGGRVLREAEQPNTTPVYAREAHVVPMQVGERATNESNLAQIELHVFLRTKSRATAIASYEFDDGETTRYRSGKTSRFVVRARARRRQLEITFAEQAMGLGPARVRIVAYDDFDELVVLGLKRSVPVRLRPGRTKFLGSTVRVRNSGEFLVT
jgi:alpha-glucosidase